MRLLAGFRSCCLALGGLALCAVANAQQYPTQTVRLIVPYSPGGQADLAVRIIAERFSDRFKQTFVVVNVPGSSGISALTQVLNAPADGYTISYADAGHWAINVALHKDLPYDPLKDFAPVGIFGETTGVFIAVNANVGIKALPELIARAKAEPGKLRYGSPGIGSIHHLIMEDFKARLGLNILHVPYKGSSQSVPALIAGETSITLSALTRLAGPAEQGKIRILAVTRQQRSALAPDVPTVAELAVPGFGHPGFEGFIARTGTPRVAVDKLSRAMADIVKAPDVVKRFAGIGFEPSSDTSPETMAKMIRVDQEKYKGLARAAGLMAK